MSRPKTIEEMNKKVVEIMEEIEKEEYFECLNDVDTQMKHHPECNDKIFYQKKQDEINLVYNQLRVFYYDICASLETYVSCRSFALMAEYELNKKEKSITVGGKKIVLSRVPGKETLRDACISEIPDLNYAMVLLKGWKNRADSALKTARNHTYGADDDTKDHEDEK